MPKVRISIPCIDASDAERGKADTHNYLNAIAASMADFELRRRLELLIQTYNRLAASGAGGGDAPHTVPGTPIFEGGRVYAFGPFRLCPSQRLLLEGDRRVQIGSRAFDILTILVEHAGEVVGKRELIGHVWPKVFVQDSNLKTQINGLRRALGEGGTGSRYIVTVSGRGYNFVAPVTLVTGMVAQGYPGDRSHSSAQRHEAARIPLPSELMHV